MNVKWKILCIGTAIRLLLAPFLAHPWDLSVWMDVGRKSIVEHVNIYEVGFRTAWTWGYYAYPPGWLGFCAISYLFAFDLRAFNFFLKIPIIAADLMLGVLIYRVLLEQTKDLRIASSGLAMYFLNPLVILVGAVWGMFDAIPTLFTFMSMIQIYRKKYDSSALLTGIGAIFKIYPAITILPILLFAVVRQRLDLRGALRYLLVFAATFLIPSLPFILFDWKSFAAALLLHTTPAGWLSYWFLLSHFSYLASEYSFYFFITIFLLLFYASSRVIRSWTISDLAFLNRTLLVTFLILFLTSPKINPQYIIWCIPSLIIDFSISRDLCGRKLYDAMWIVGSALVLVFLPFNQFFVVGLKVGYPTMNILSSLLAISMIFPLLFLALSWKGFRYFLSGNPSFIKVRPGRFFLAVGVLTVVFLLSSPLPSTVHLPGVRHVVALPESPQAGFDFYAADLGVGAFLNKYPVNSVGLLLGPDFVNTYRAFAPDNQIGVFSKVRYYEEWTQFHLVRLVNTLHARNVKVLLAVSFIANNVVGTRGYTSTWLNDRHSEVLGENIIIPYLTMKGDSEYGIVDETKYYTYFADRCTAIIQDFGFDGVFICDVGMRNAVYTEHSAAGYVEAFKFLSRVFLNNGKDLLTEDFFGQDAIDLYVAIIPHVSGLVLKTYPWARGFFFAEAEKTLSYYEMYIQSLLSRLSLAERSKLLFTLETMDEQEGWFTPYLFLRNELNGLLKMNLDGVVIAHANRFSPYTIAID